MIPTGRKVRDMALSYLNGQPPSKTEVRRVFGATEKGAAHILDDIERQAEIIARDALHSIPRCGTRGES